MSLFKEDWYEYENEIYYSPDIIDIINKKERSANRLCIIKTKSIIPCLTDVFILKSDNATQNRPYGLSIDALTVDVAEEIATNYVKKWTYKEIMNCLIMYDIYSGQFYNVSSSGDKLNIKHLRERVA